jgi:hypothetical protein
MESDPFKLTRSYPRECRHCKQLVFRKSVEAKFDGAEVGVVSKINGVMR